MGQPEAGPRAVANRLIVGDAIESRAEFAVAPKALDFLVDLEEDILGNLFSLTLMPRAEDGSDESEDLGLVAFHECCEVVTVTSPFEFPNQKIIVHLSA